MPTETLPHIDEHTVEVAADAATVHRHLSETVERSFSRPSAARYARLVGTTDRHRTGPRPLSEGSAFPGFHVVTAVPGRELVLHGGHRFSAYALHFRIDPTSPGHCRLRAETRAAFPGLGGGLYRRLVIGTGGHALMVRRLLTAVRRRAEAG